MSARLFNFKVGRGVAKVVQTKFDARTLHERPAVAAESRMVDDGKGAKEVCSVLVTHDCHVRVL